MEGNGKGSFLEFSLAGFSNGISFDRDKFFLTFLNSSSKVFQEIPNRESPSKYHGNGKHSLITVCY